MIDPAFTDQIVFVCFDESTSMKFKPNGCNPRDGEKSKAQISSDNIRVLLQQVHRLHIGTIIGLISFNSEVTVLQELTPITSDLRNKLQLIKPHGRTLLWDAINTAADLIIQLVYDKNPQHPKVLFPNAKLRIIVITDGEDNKSTITSSELANKLIENQIVVDTIMVSDKTSSKNYCFALSKLTGGFLFFPSSIEEGVRIFSQESFLDLNSRINPVPAKLPITEEKFEEESNNIKISNFPPNIEVEKSKIQIQLVTPQFSIQQYKNNQPYEISKRYALRELTNIISNPDNNYKVYVSYSTPTEWHVFIRGPNGSSFSNKWLYLFVVFTYKCPVRPPIFRFLTVPYHPNVSNEGGVNFKLIDKLYNAQNSMIFILDNIIKLLTELEPDRTLNDEALECFLKNQSEYYNRQKNNESFKSDYHEYIGDVSIFTDSSSFDLKQHLVSNPGSDRGRELDVLNLDILDLYD